MTAASRSPAPHSDLQKPARAPHARAGFFVLAMRFTTEGAPRSRALHVRGARRGRADKRILRATILKGALEGPLA